MEPNKNLRARYAVQKLIIKNDSEITDDYPWFWEHDRWKELVFAILTRVVDRPHTEVRLITDQLYSMGLLNISSLAAIPIDKSTALEDNELAYFILDFLKESGLTDSEISRSITALCQLATGFEKNYDGKTQQYLRTYGEMMLKELSANFSFTSLKDEEVRYAFVYWLQNVSSMPISLDDRSIKEFSQQNGLSEKELVSAADDYGINLAFLDDLVQNYQQIDEEEKMDIPE